MVDSKKSYLCTPICKLIREKRQRFDALQFWESDVQDPDSTFNTGSHTWHRSEKGFN